YSFVILSLAACSEVFGFVVMTPQVFLNYRLKSVEHLPWRALSYQACNTFIDDVFTLVIRVIMSDQGGCSMSTKFKKILTETNIVHVPRTTA
ncbi:hypothetical protein Pmar_PMAR008601, partial [Perkinsus marinus ATCC 50983]